MELNKKLYRYAEAGQVLSVSVRHVHRLVEEGKLERVFVGQGHRSARITAESIERYIHELVHLNGSVLHPP